MSENLHRLNFFSVPAKAQTKEYAQLYCCSQALSLALLSQVKTNPIAVITADVNHAQQLQNELSFFTSGKCKILELPDWETLPYDTYSPHQDIGTERLKTLYKFPTISQGILIVPVATVMQKVVPHDYIKQFTFLLKTGDVIDVEAFTKQLESGSYYRVGQV